MQYSPAGQREFPRRGTWKNCAIMATGSCRPIQEPAPPVILVQCCVLFRV